MSIYITSADVGRTVIRENGKHDKIMGYDHECEYCVSTTYGWPADTTGGFWHKANGSPLLGLGDGDSIAAFADEEVKATGEPSVEGIKTLRDEFAMAALTGLCADPYTAMHYANADELAKDAYDAADAMLEARKVK